MNLIRLSIERPIAIVALVLMIILFGFLGTAVRQASFIGII